MKKLWEGWKRIAKAIGNFNARVIMTIFYFIFLSPLSIPVKAKDPLVIRGKKKAGWNPRPPAEDTPMEQALRQF
jgi:hypothetical protein